MRLNRIHGRFAAIVLMQQMVACGGGGDVGDPPPPPPPPPLVVAQTFTGTEDTDVNATLVLRPATGDTATVAVVTPPTRGTLSSFNANGAFTYRPNANLNGADTFTVEATDSRSNRLSAVVTVNLSPVNDAPLAVGEILEVATGPAVTVNVLTNDSDVDDAALSVVIPAAAAGAAESNPAVGTATVDANNRIQLALPAEFRGVTRVSYRVRDAAGLQSEVVNAVVFVGTPQFDVWFQGPVGSHPGQIFATDLLGTRQVTQFVMPRKSNGAVISRNGDVALIVENDGNDLRDLWTVRTQVVEPPVRMTPGHDATQTIDQSAISPDGAWVAYVVQSAGAKQLWLVERADPGGRRQILLRFGHQIYGFQNLKFTANSNALYYVTQSAGAEHLNRVTVADPLHPQAIYPREGEGGRFTEWFLSPDDSYVVVRYVDLLRVSVADPAVRTTVNAPIPAGHYIGSVIADASATRFVYLTVEVNDQIHTDDQLWMTDLGQPGVSTLLVAADAARTGPLSQRYISPNRNNVLVDSWVAALGTFQLNMTEVSLAPVDGVMHPLSLPPPANSRTVSSGEYVDDDTVVFTELEPLMPSRLYQARRGSFGTPTLLVEPGVMSSFFRFSSDKAVLTTTHSRNSPEDPSHYGIVVNRAAPGAMLRVTPPTSNTLSPFFIDLVERD